MSKIMSKLTAVIMAAALTTSCIPVIAATEEDGYRDCDYPADYAKLSGGGKTVFDVDNPQPLKNVSAPVDGTVEIINDGSNELPAEGYYEFGEMKGGIASVSFDFSFDRRMDDTTFRLLGGKKAAFSLITHGNGIYLEQRSGDIYLCALESAPVQSRKKYVVKLTLDFDHQSILSIQINGKTVVQNKAFFEETDYADGFDIRTSEAAVGVVQITGLYIHQGYIINESFQNGSDTVSDDWDISGEGFAAIANRNSKLSYSSYLTLDSRDGDILLKKQIPEKSGKITLEINVMQPEKRGDFEINIEGGGQKIASLSANGTSFCYMDENSNMIPFYDYIKNMWYNLELHIDTDTGLYDIDLNNRRIKSGLKLLHNSGKIEELKIYSGKSTQAIGIDDILLYRTKPYPEDYPVINEEPEKKDGAPLVGVQFCPMWINGNHFGWDWIKQASDRRKPVTGFFDGDSSEQADWVIKYLLEHGVDYMSICMFPHNNNVNSSDKMSQIYDKDLRSCGFISAVQNSRYSDKIKYSIFLEANGIKNGYEYYEDFFNTVWPYYIEQYFKDPRYLKVNGRPVFGVYAVSNLLNVFDDGRGKPAVIEGVNRMRQMCIDAGVGDPYLVSNDNNYAQLQNVASVGFDAVSSYGFGYDATFTTQKTIMENTLQECKKEGIDFIPSPVPMRDDTAWRVGSGYWHTEEEFAEFLDWMREDLLTGYKSSVGDILCNMCTWDEYGEGHIICPTEGLGFSYLDAIRSSLTNGSDHKDDWPSDAQKKRMTRYYSQDRKINTVTYESTVDYKVFYEAREKDVDEKIPTDVKKGWYFNNSNDAAAWSGVSGVENVKSTSEGLEVYASGTRPRIKLSNFNGIDVYDVTYAKIRMKKNPTSGGGFFYWSSDMHSMDNDNKLFFNAGTDSGDEFKDYYVPLSSKVTWTGKVNGIEIMLGDISDLSKPFVIESIELLRDSDITSKDKLIVNSRIQSLTDEYRIEDDVLMIPLKEVFYMAGATEIKSLVTENAYTIKYHDQLSKIVSGQKTARVNGNEITLSKAAFTKSDIVNDTMYVPLQFAEDVLYDKEFIWDEATRTLTINSVEEEEAGLNREVIYSIDYDDESSAGNPIGLSGILFKDGKMTATTTSNDPNFTVATNINAEDVKFIQMKINTDTAQMLKYYFLTSKDSTWGEGKGSAIVTTKAGNNTILFDTSMVSTWKDIITRFRIDPAVASGQTFSIDSVIFYGDELSPSTDTEEKKKDMTSCVKADSRKYEWPFNKNTELDGWQFSKSMGETQIKSGKLEAVITGISPSMVNYGEINIDTEKISSIDIKYMNKTNSRKLKVYFITDKERQASEKNSFEIEVAPMSNSVVDYGIDTGKNENWKGILKKLIIVPEANTHGSISFDSIGLALKNSEDTQ